MTRVPPSRVPQPARPAAPQGQVQRARRPRSAEKLDKPQKLKGPGQGDEAGEALQSSEAPGQSQDLTGEHDSKHLEQHAESQAPESHAEATERKDAVESVRSESERKEEAQKTGRAPLAKKDDGESKAQTATAQKRQSDGFEGAKQAGRGSITSPQPLAAHAPLASAAPVQGVQTQALPPPPPSRPQDAFQLLHQAQPAGVYFKEDQFRDGHAEDQEDPALAAAVEEAIRLLFGVRGILRVGPGKNMENEPVVVVVATQGFGEASLASVPPAVKGFATVLAVPFDLLPLKKER